MKTCAKLTEPASLTAYRAAQPEGTWDRMRDDPHHGGQQAYRDIKRTLVAGQRGLCAYCEMRIADGMGEAEIAAKSRQQRVEHFHPKDDVRRPPNWALHWPNLWAVCLGGSGRPPSGEPHDESRFLPPLPENLSCDAFKDHQIKAGKLPHDPEGWILAPDEVPAFPLLFRFTSEGRPEPHAENCAGVVLPNNRHPDTVTLVEYTIENLNIGCSRLNRNRSRVSHELERMIKRARELSPGVPPPQVMLHLARRLLSASIQSPWPEYFTLIRCRLRDAAEVHLRSIGFAG